MTLFVAILSVPSAFAGSFQAASSGVSVGRAQNRFGACMMAKTDAHRDRCPTLSKTKTVSACKCEPNASGVQCEVAYEATCRTLSPFSPAYAMTGTAEGISIVSRAMACDAAERNADVYVCLRDRLDWEHKSCECDRLSDGWHCGVEFRMWCM